MANMLKSRIHRRKPKGKAMPEHRTCANASKSAICAKVEYIFAHQKNRYFAFNSTIGLARALANSRWPIWPITSTA
jgi:transposase, IS5 family